MSHDIRTPINGIRGIVEIADHNPFEIDHGERKKEISKGGIVYSIKGMKILLVEDNDLNMEVAEYLLREEGAVITKVWNGQEAVD